MAKKNNHPDTSYVEAGGRLEDQVCFALYAASRATTAAYRPYLDQLGLTYPRYIVMLVLWEHDGIAIGELGQRLYLDTGTLSPLLKKLARDGLVTRVRDERDERVVRIGLTARGRELRNAAAQMRNRLSCRLGLSPHQVNALRSRVQIFFNQMVQIVEASNEAGIHSRSDGNGRPRRARDFVGQEPGRSPFVAQGAGRQRRARDHQS
jgi:MarR family transcriptional regulator, organic hydroperoxide resistance regulator